MKLPLENEIPLDLPSIPIRWDWSIEDFKASYPKPDHFKGPFVSLFGISPLTCHGYVYQGRNLNCIVFHSPPQTLRSEIPSYAMASELCRKHFGAPTIEEFSSFCLWPDHVRLCWLIGDVEVLLFIDDIFWNSMETMTIQIQRIDRSRWYSGWNPWKKRTEQGAAANP